MELGLSGWHLNIVKEAECRHEANGRQILAIDESTGLANFPSHSETVESEIKRSKRSRREFAVLLFDLNGIKQIDARLDPLARARSLYRLAHISRSSCRLLDTVARYGDDKIAIVLPESGAEAAGFVESRICDRVTVDHQMPLVSVSVGAAIYPWDGNTLDTLFQAAVRAVSKKKEQAEEAERARCGLLPFVNSIKERIPVPVKVNPLTYAKVQWMTR